MIAESKSADAEEKTANAETEKSSADIPDAVISAVESKITDLRKEIQRNADQAASLLQHNDNHIKRIEILEKWLREVRNESTEN